ncbi:MAG TPA: LysM peptidoglycan-binding domain-containing protein [Verrucomicrobiae bacterium]|nr:LysM peptidoglycan-binding domain-containing protein [Verrucomicrobiae bacterium]
MKTISFLLVSAALCVAPVARGQDAATAERLNRLSGQLDDIQARQEALQKQFDELRKELSDLRDQASKPAGNYASQEDVKSLTEAVKEIDRKRLEDYDKIRAELLKLGRNLAAAPLPKRMGASSSAEPSATDKPARPENGYEYVVKSKDTLSNIAQAYRDNNIKVSMEQILKANPGLKPERLRVGQKIFIPAPQTKEAANTEVKN